MAPDTGQLVAAILNAAYMVRHLRRGSRLSSIRAQRDQAIVLLGATVRDALNQSDDHEAILAAVVDGLRPIDTPPF